MEGAKQLRLPHGSGQNSKRVKRDSEKRRGLTPSKRLAAMNVGGIVILDDDSEWRVVPNDVVKVAAWEHLVPVRIEPRNPPASFQLMVNEDTGEVVGVLPRQVPNDPFSQVVRLSRKR
jgi:hypothetical protein